MSICVDDALELCVVQVPFRQYHATQLGKYGSGRGSP